MTESYTGGIHSVKAALKSAPDSIDRLLLQRGRRDNRLAAIRQLAQQQSIKVVELPRQQLDRLVPEIQHQGVVAVLRADAPQLAGDLMAVLETCLQGPRPPLVLILDEVQDPHNLGACLRSADAVAADAVVVPIDNSVGLTPVVRKVASGAADTVPLVQVTNLKRALEQLKAMGFWIYGAAGEKDLGLYELDLQGPVALVLGAEGSGLRRLTRDGCDQLYGIPMLGSVSSLNVSVAAGISLFEVRRQQQASSGN